MDTRDIVRKAINNSANALEPVLRDEFLNWFDSKGNNTWRPLSPKAAKRNTPTLVKTGSLRTAVSMTEVSISREHVIVDVISKVYKHHRYGTAKMPARPPIGLSQKSLDRVSEQLAETIVAELKANGIQATAHVN